MEKIIINFLLFTFSFTISTAQTAKEKGTNFINKIFQKYYEEALSLFDESVKTKVTVNDLQKATDAIEANAGKYKTIIEVNEEKKQQYNTVYYYTQFEKSQLDIKIVFNNVDNIVGFFFAPHKDFNATIKKVFDKNAYLLNIKLDSVELPGIIMKASDTNNIKVLTIFVHGSGPQDKDGTIGENKPFKDIAEGLCKYGISSYRFDKRTKVAPQFFNTYGYTIDDEVTNDIYGIVHFFNRNDTFKDYKIVLIGHSLGGMLLPKIADSLKNKISGIIMLAANARPLDVLLLEQYNYIYSLNPNTETKKEIEELKIKIKFLHSKKNNSTVANNQLPLNLPFSYWNSLLQYQQTKTISNITVPIFILQGLRDYQVTIKDYKFWEKALHNHENVAFATYPKLNHLFMEGIEKSTPQEYSTPSHVAQYLTNDIAEWILKIK